MPQPRSFPYDAWMETRVEAYIDDTLPPDERSRFEARLWADPYWQEQVERARSIRVALRDQSPPSPPTSLTDAILQHPPTSRLPKEKT